MAAKFFIRNGGWLISSRTRLNLSKTIKHFPVFQNSVLITRPLLTASCVHFDEKSNRVVVKWNDDLTDEYPVVWLRDNCQCPACFDQSSQSRNTDFSKLKLDSKPKNSVVEKDKVEVFWKDGHKSAYDFKWLKNRSFNPNERQKWLDSHKAPYKTWLASDFESIPVFDFQSVMKDDRTLLEWLQTLDVWGVSRLTNVPNSLGQAGNLANRVGFIKKTHYEEQFNVTAKANHNNLAYTEGYLQLHTDLPVYEYMPGINLLQCYIQYSGEGGDSLLVDGFKIAELLREIDPESYKLLSGTVVTWFDVGQEFGNYFHKINHSPVICESSNKTISRINYHNPQRDSHLAINIDQVENWYYALKKFYDLALDPRNLVEFKLEPGQMITFDNLRVLHGRTAFGVNIKGERHLQGTYLDWDEARSKIRVLKAKLANKI